MPDCIVIGGGVIGLSAAWELSQQGLQVTLLDQSEPGREASWAGAGMLPPGNVATAVTPEERLRSHSHALWSDWSERLRDLTGIDNGFRVTGGLELRLDVDQTDSHVSLSQIPEEVAYWRRHQVVVEDLAIDELRSLEHGLSLQVAAGYYLPGFAQVRNPRHLKALIGACNSWGVDIRAGVAALDFFRNENRVTSVRTTLGDLSASHVVIAGGAWSQPLIARLGGCLQVQPLRGQIVLLHYLPHLMRHIINVGHRYLVPRGDGRILIGSTEERAGFDKRSTVEGVEGLLTFARSIIPNLAKATIERTWAGLRPQSIDGMPYIGRVNELDNVIVAAGHFRSGLQMSPATAVVVRQTVMGQELAFSLDGLQLGRRGESTCVP